MQIQEFGAPDEVLIRIASQPTEEEQQKSIARVKEALGKSVEYRRTEIVGPTISSELIAGGTVAVVVVLILLAVALWSGLRQPNLGKLCFQVADHLTKLAAPHRR